MTQVLFVFSDTGGGHRAAATALQRALHRLAPCTQSSLVDPFALSQRWPFNRLAAAYPRVVDNASWLWKSGFRLTNTIPCSTTLQAIAWPALRSTFEALRDREAPDVIVSTHPLLTTPLRRAFRDTPIMVVVTDLVSGHCSWYDRRADALILPSLTAQRRAVAYGVSMERTEVLGVPVDATFEARPGERERLRQQLGWSLDRPTVLLVGGGDGVGPLAELAAAIDAANLGCDVAVVTGKNRALARQLAAQRWLGTVHVYGFVNNLGEMLRAASALVSKAGPGTISEACAAGCPMVLHSAIPGQETGNIAFVREGGAGVWAPSADLVVAALRSWFVEAGGAFGRERAATAARAMARPQAATEIAQRILHLARTGRGGTMTRLSVVRERRPWLSVLRRGPRVPAGAQAG